eukprot:TRINITY_DN2282_c0_g1_i1.p1 TRINITY_DN2282_c0_g1~~TRINITY_DN2282_c0_g1_i1.p1  ORF type:complete len:340 (+),score=69.97 TRINITY_DN2282_c0_g1_i1:218-1237(+)
MATDAAVLLVTDVAALPARVVLWAVRAFEDKLGPGKDVAVITQATGAELKATPLSVDVYISLAETPGYHSASRLNEIVRVLRPGGTLLVQEPLARRAVSAAEAQRLGQLRTSVQTQAVLERNLLLAGFVEARVDSSVEGVGLASTYNSINAESEDTALGPLFQHVAVRVQKPTWSTGESFGLKKASAKQDLKVKSNGAAVKLASEEMNELKFDFKPPSSNGSSLWKVTATDFDDELVDEDELLTEEDRRAPVLPVDDDCEVGKAGKKACKNCTCGRAETEAGEEFSKPTVAQLNNPKSACGSCGLGDAFRCGSCPYKGLPPFKLGEKIALGGSLLTADV